MKRESITEIIGKVQVLTYRVHHSGLSNKMNARIRKAAVNEILRLEAEENNNQFKRGFSEGYEAGFECATIAAQSIVTAGKRFDEVDQSTDLQNEICGGVKP